MKKKPRTYKLSMKKMAARLQKHLGFTTDEVMEEAVRNLYAFLFNE